MGWTLGGTALTVVDYGVEQIGSGGEPFMVEGATKPTMMYPDTAAYWKFNLVIWAMSKTDHDAILGLLDNHTNMTLVTAWGTSFTVAAAGNPTTRQIKASPTSAEVSSGYTIRHLHEISLELLEVA